MPHLGTVLQLLSADIFARFLRLEGHDVLTATGSDCHGTPIEVAAEQEGISPAELVERNHSIILELLKEWQIELNYSTTANPFHYRFVQDLVRRCYDNGYIFSREEETTYCSNCKRFLPDRFVEGTCPHCEASGARGDQCDSPSCGKPLKPTELIDPYCVVCHNPPTRKLSKQWYYDFPKFQDTLHEYIVNNSILPDNAKRFSMDILDSETGILPRALTRDLKWGIPAAPAIPETDVGNKTFYVWFEAVLGYTSASAEWGVKHKNDPNYWKQFWLNKNTKTVFFIGKDNIFFHTLLFPALLLGTEESYGTSFVLPYNVSTTEFLMFENEPFSKSRGIGIWINEAIELLPSDYWRYYLAATRPEIRDTSFIWSEFENRINTDLNDVIGNFIHRTLVLIYRYFDGVVPAQGSLDTIDKEFLKKIRNIADVVADAFYRFEYREAVSEIANFGRAANGYMSTKEPWKLIKSDKERTGTVLHLCIQAVRALSILLAPLTPTASQKVWEYLNLEGNATDQNWKSASEVVIPENHKIKKPTTVFTKIKAKDLQAKLETIRGQKMNEKSKGTAKIEKEYVTMEDIKKLGLKLAKIVSAEPVPKTSRLMKMEIDVGENKPRQIVAGIAEQYKPDQLIGKRIAVVTKMKPAKIRSIKSNGMLLAAFDGTTVGLLIIDTDLPPGTPIS